MDSFSVLKVCWGRKQLCHAEPALLFPPVGLAQAARLPTNPSPEGESPTKGHVTEQPQGRPSWLPESDGNGFKERPTGCKLPSGNPSPASDAEKWGCVG